MHKGETFGDVVEKHPNYIYWCCKNVKGFDVSKNLIAELRVLYPDFIIPAIIIPHISSPVTLYNQEEMDEVSDSYDYEEDDEDSYTFFSEEPQHYGRYSGRWAQDIEGWSDEDIDDVLDGDPDAYWNLD